MAHATDQYARMKFPPYVHKEYPKWITLDNGAVKLVNTQHEEILARGQDPGPDAPSANPVVAENQALKEQVSQMQAQLAQLLQRMGERERGAPHGAASESLPVPPANQLGSGVKVAQPQDPTSQGERALALSSKPGVVNQPPPGVSPSGQGKPGELPVGQKSPPPGTSPGDVKPVNSLASLGKNN